MFVSDVQVLRRFAKKLAATGGGGDATPEMSNDAGGDVDLNEKPLLLPGQSHNNEPAAPKVEKGPSTAAKIEMARNKGVGVQNSMLGKTMGALRQAREGVTGAATSLYNNATPANLGYAAAGAGLGGGALYGISRLLQSEEDRKKKTPMVAPAVGAVAGGVALPLLMEALKARGSRAAFANSRDTSGDAMAGQV